jgi:hypothetical protein
MANLASTIGLSCIITCYEFREKETNLTAYPDKTMIDDVD